MGECAPHITVPHDVWLEAIKRQLYRTPRWTRKGGQTRRSDPRTSILGPSGVSRRQFRGHNAYSGCLGTLRFRPGFLGVRTRATMRSKRSTNVVLPSGRPVRLCRRMSRSSCSGSPRFSRAFQSPAIASKGATLTRRPSRPCKCGLALLQRHSAAAGTNPGPHRIQFDVPRGGQQVRFIHDERAEPPLPQIATPFFAEIHPSRITPMGFANGPPQRLFRCRHGDQVDVIRHQAVAPNLDALFAAPVGHQFHIGGIVFLVEKRPLSTVAALGHVVRHARNDYPGGDLPMPKPGQVFPISPLLVLCPRNPNSSHGSLSSLVVAPPHLPATSQAGRTGQRNVSHFGRLRPGRFWYSEHFTRPFRVRDSVGS